MLVQAYIMGFFKTPLRYWMICTSALPVL